MDRSLLDQSAESGFWAWLKRIATPIGSLIGAIILVYQIIQLWRGDQATITWLSAGFGALLILASIVYVGFSQITHQRQIQTNWTGALNSTWNEPRFPRWQKSARWGLIFYTLMLIGLGGYFWKYGENLDEKTIILLTQIDGPDPKNYRVTDIIYNALEDQLAGYYDIKIILLNETVTEVDGREKALQLGKRYHANMVLWGWYGATESDALLTLHIENLKVSKYIPFVGSSEQVKAQVAISELESFTLQQNLGEGVGNLTLFISGLAHYETGDYPNALERFDKALDTPILLSDLIGIKIALFFRGNTQLRLSHYELALADYNQAIQFDPQFAEAYFGRGVVYYFLGQYEKAISDFGQAIYFYPYYSDAYYNRGLAYADLGQYEQAISDYTRVIQMDAQNTCVPCAYYKRGLAYSNLGDYENAMSDYNQAVQLNPQFLDDGVYYYNRGVVYLGLDQFENAINEFNQAIMHDPTNAFAYNNRGFAYERLGQYEQAITDYKAALLLDPKLAIAFQNLGNVYIDLEKYEQAIGMYDNAIRLNPEDSQSFINRGFAYNNLGYYDQAIIDFTKAIQINPQYVIAYYNRALTFYVLGQKDQARADFQQVVSLCSLDQELCLQAQKALETLFDE